MKVLLSNEEYCTQIRYGMRLFSMRNLKIRLIYHREMGKISKLKLGSAVEPPYWALRRRWSAKPSSEKSKENESNDCVGSEGC